MAIQTGGEQGGIFASINITPLTDIFLVLLIIFMVATAITVESAAHVELPKPQASSQNQLAALLPGTQPPRFLRGCHIVRLLRILCASAP